MRLMSRPPHLGQVEDFRSSSITIQVQLSDRSDEHGKGCQKTSGKPKASFAKERSRLPAVNCNDWLGRCGFSPPHPTGAPTQRLCAVGRNWAMFKVAAGGAKSTGTSAISKSSKVRLTTLIRVYTNIFCVLHSSFLMKRTLESRYTTAFRLDRRSPHLHGGNIGRYFAAGDMAMIWSPRQSMV